MISLSHIHHLHIKQYTTDSDAIRIYASYGEGTTIDDIEHIEIIIKTFCQNSLLFHCQIINLKNSFIYTPYLMLRLLILLLFEMYPKLF